MAMVTFGVFIPHQGAPPPRRRVPMCKLAPAPRVKHSERCVFHHLLQRPHTRAQFHTQTLQCHSSERPARSLEYRGPGARGDRSKRPTTRPGPSTKTREPRAQPKMPPAMDEALGSLMPSLCFLTGVGAAFEKTPPSTEF